MKNQRGEIVTGLMVAMMVVMMIVGGMRMMHGDHKHGDHKSEDGQAQTKHDHGDADEMHQTPGRNDQTTGASQEEGK